MSNCACCGAELVHDSPSRRFCDGRCRQAAYRRRRARLPEARPSCAHCFAPLDPRPGPGSPRRFCPGGRCRQAAYRRRRARLPESTPGLEPGGRRRLADRDEAVRWERMTEVERLLAAIAPIDVAELLATVLGRAEA
jgi:hypothetical protein